MADERAVSETLGYIMIFGIVVAGIAMVYLIGSHIIANTQESASFQGLEQSFAVVASDIRSTAFEESPMMTTRVSIDYGVMSLMPEADSGTMIILTGNDSSDVKYVQPIGVLTFNSQTYGKSITLENGALVKMQDGNGAYGSSMALQPRIFFSRSTNTLMVTVINLKGTYGGYTGGIGNIQTQYQDDSRLEQFTGLSNARICIKTNYTGAWNDFFASSMLDVSKTIETTGDPDHWTNVTFDGVSKLMVVTYNIKVQI
jgi:hypothetical protein